jgi:hypothetical protein
MATATVSLPQQIPHMPIPRVPRVRPPRILKGTPSPNSVAQPAGPAPSGKVWAQGQWRDPASNSAKASRQHQSRQVEKALRHDTHGQNIYAYANIRTNQVVYSLTRVMSVCSANPSWRIDSHNDDHIWSSIWTLANTYVYLHRIIRSFPNLFTTARRRSPLPSAATTGPLISACTSPQMNTAPPPASSPTTNCANYRNSVSWLRQKTWLSRRRKTLTG